MSRPHDILMQAELTMPLEEFLDAIRDGRIDSSRVLAAVRVLYDARAEHYRRVAERFSASKSRLEGLAVRKG